LNRFIGRFRNVVVTYAENLSAFSPNARLYLLSVIITGASLGVYRLLFNFYGLSLGFANTQLGNMVSISSGTALLVALPMGYIADKLGRKISLLLGGFGQAVAVIVISLFPSITVFSFMNILIGFSSSLAGVSMGMFLIENSGEKERTYLFSINSGIQMVASAVGNWVGGYLPTWLGNASGVTATSTTAYGYALMTIGFGALVGVLPLVFLKKPNLQPGQRSSFAPLSYLGKHFNSLGKLVLPMLITSIGAGLIMPFMNVFFRQVYNQPDPVVGSMLAWGALAMGIGLLIAPPLADKYGKIQLVVVTQAISIPFLFLLGFAPWFLLSAVAYYIRIMLMNMSGPVYQTFVMEEVEPKARATVASLVSMASNFGWFFSPTISGWIQDNYGFKPAFACTLVLYVISVYFYWRFFWKPKKMDIVDPGIIAGSTVPADTLDPK